MSSTDNTRFGPPAVNLGVIDRPRLSELLSARTQHPLTLVVAPAGYGKSTAVSQWAATSGRPIAWVTLTETETCYEDLAQSIARAVRGTLPESRQRAYDAVLQERRQVAYAGQTPERRQGAYAGVTGASRATTEDEGVVDVGDLARSIAALDWPFTLIVDRVPASLDADQRNLLGDIAEHLPSCVRMVIISRSHPDIPISRLRADGAVTEIRYEALAFTISEARELLCDRLRLSLTADQIATLCARTEGWVAGIRLAALTLQDSSDVAISVEVFNGTNRYIQSYLTDEVLSRQPRHVRDFLLRTSMVSPFDAELAGVIASNNVSDVLEHVMRENLFVVPVDETNKWYRYHHLFSDVLRFRLEREKPDEIAPLHRLACRWFRDRNRPHAATRHAIELRDWDLAVSLLEPLGGPAAVQFQSIVTWIRTLPEDALRAQPTLSLWNAWAELQAGQIRAAERAIDFAEQVWKARGETSHRGEILFLRSRVARCRAEGRLAVSLGEQALAALPASAAPLRALTLISIARGYVIEGHVVDAEAAAREAYAIAQDDETAETALGMSLAHIGRALASQGRLTDAYNTYHESAAASSHSTGMPIHIMVYLAELHVDRCELDKAAEYLADAGLRLRQENMGFLKPDLWLQLARVAYAQGNSDAALSTLEHVMSWSRRSGSRVSLANTEALRARIWLNTGEYGKAQAWLDRCGLDEDADITHEQEPAYYVLARHLMHQHGISGKVAYIDRALRILRHLGGEAMGDKRPLDAVQAMLLGAIAREVRGDSTKAISHLERALTIALPERALRVILDEGDALLKLALSVRERGLGSSHIDEIIAIFNTVGTEERQDPLPIEPRVAELSKREQEILRYIAAGLTNQEIADRMFISVNTVKTHLKHIFTKVGATSRAQAIARAFALGLL